MKKEQVFNYIGSLVFVSIILLFLFSLVFISRFALDDTSGLQEYVESTKILLEEIDEVQQQVSNTSSNPTRIDLKNLNVFDSSYDIIDGSYKNIRDEGAFFTIKFNSTITENEKYFILEVDKEFDYVKGQRIIYLNNEGIVLENEENSLEVYDLETARIGTINKQDIEGVIIYEKN